MTPSPFQPLVAGGQGLDRYPTSLAAVQTRMGELYGVAADHVLVVRGVTHGLELAVRRAALDGSGVTSAAEPPITRLRQLYRLPADGPDRIAILRPSDLDQLSTLAAAMAYVIVDEGYAEFSGIASVIPEVRTRPNLIVLRSLSAAYGLAGARVGAAIAQPDALAWLSAALEPHPVPEPSLRLALDAMHPSRMAETSGRIERVREERRRVAERLSARMTARAAEGPAIIVRPADLPAARTSLTRHGVAWTEDGDDLSLAISLDRAVNDRLLAALDAAPASARPNRVGTIVRDTRETRIVCAVDLDAPAPVQIDTGVGFFDHMLEQVAAHGGFSLRLSCLGDLETDPHHTVEDCAIALGQAMKQALGERRGIARYGFVLPMDDAEAKVSIDLSGRPYAVFEGDFRTPALGDYRTDLTEHVVRSLAEHLGAAVHVSVTGVDDHHKTEAVYKAVGRALRQAFVIESDRVPSTKGVL